MLNLPKQNAGITLVELVVTIVILSIALLGIAATLNFGVSQSSNTLFELRATALAQSYLDEILSKKFDERSRNSGIPPCRATGLSGRNCTTTLGANGSESARTSFDDVDDYNGLDEGANSSPAADLLDAQGVVRAGYAGFRVQVSVSLIDLVTPDPVATFPGGSVVLNPIPDDVYDAKLITVTVTDGSADGLKFSAYKSNF